MRLRTVAATMTYDVLNGISLLDHLEQELSQFDDPRDRAWVQAVVFGVCRHYYSLMALLNRLLTQPEKLTDLSVQAILLVGLYQLKYMRMPSFAVVSETVNAAKKIKQPWAAGLVNAVLRSYLRLQEKNKTEELPSLEAQFDHPLWWIELLQEDYPEQAIAILEANQQHPPMTLRVNSRKNTREEYMAACIEKGIECVPCDFSPVGIRLMTPVSVQELPGFSRGWVSVQDEAAQLAATLLDVQPHDVVLDACAAPGGKLTHLLEQHDDIKLFALEKDKYRAEAIQDNLKRLQLSAICKVGDAAKVASLFPNQQFDRILLDLPCSGSGVVRRHPDIKLLREQSDLTRFADEQYRILKSVWPILKPGGTLLYATCSLFPDENEVVVSHFLQHEQTASIDVIDAAWGHACALGRQVLPGEHDMDGFYYARLKKQRD